MIKNLVRRQIVLPKTLKLCRKLSNEPDKKLPISTSEEQKMPDKNETRQRKINWHLKESEYYNFLRTFYSEDNRLKTMKFLQLKFDLSPQGIKDFYNKTIEEMKIQQQVFIPDRHRTLGTELAAAHFIVARGGAVKFHNENVWIKQDENKKYNLPGYFEEDKKLEGIDCSEMDIFYEGFSNLEGLENVTWLSLNGCEYIDDWCLDKIGNIFSHSLVYLDLRNCKRITERGLVALYKLENLKLLYLDDLLKDTIYEMTCLLLQEVNPYLDIRSTELQIE